MNEEQIETLVTLLMDTDTSKWTDKQFKMHYTILEYYVLGCVNKQ